MVASDQDIAVRWLLSVLLFVLVTAAAMVIGLIRWRRYQKARAKLEEAEETRTERDSPLEDLPQFALKRAGSWLAVKGANAQAVQLALELHNPKRCSWAEGLSADGEQRLFVSPPVSGWTLVIGPALPDPAEDVDVCFRFLLDLSRKLGHVQYFSVHAALDHHAWVRAEAGKIVRAYAWAGKTLWNQGNPTPAEGALNMKCREYGELAEPAIFGLPEHGPGNSDNVHSLAARWSIDPGEIDERFIVREWGIVGETSRPF